MIEQGPVGVEPTTSEVIRSQVVSLVIALSTVFQRGPAASSQYQEQGGLGALPTELRPHVCGPQSLLWATTAQTVGAPWRLVVHPYSLLVGLWTCVRGSACFPVPLSQPVNEQLTPCQIVASGAALAPATGDL